MNGDWTNRGENTDASQPGGGDVIHTRIGTIYTGTFYFSGMIAEVAVWNIALVQAEVEALAARASPLSVRPDKLKVYLPMISVTALQSIVGNYTWSAINTPASATHIGLAAPQSGMSMIWTPSAGVSAVPAMMRYYRNRRSA